MVSRIVLNTISYHGKGAIEKIPEELQARGYKKAFVCSDPDLLKFGVTQKVTDLLDKASFPYSVYSEIKPNPTIENVQHGVEAFKVSGADCIVTIGGGSSMDTASSLRTRSSQMFALWRALRRRRSTRCSPLLCRPLPVLLRK